MAALIASLALHFAVLELLPAEQPEPVRRTIRIDASMEFLAPLDGAAGAPGSGSGSGSASAAAIEELPDDTDEIRHMTAAEESFPSKDASNDQIKEKSKPAPPKPARKNPINDRLRQFQRFILQEDLKGSYGSGSGIGVTGGSGQNGLYGYGTGGGSAIGSYIVMIATKIQKNVNRNLCRAGRPEIEFAIILRPDGQLEGAPRILRSSGIASCDDAIERAILQSLPLPVPSDSETFASLRELNLLFRPHDENFGSRD